MKKYDKQGKRIIIVLIIIILLVIIYFLSIVPGISKTYEFAKDGEIFKSDHCYQKENGDAYCKYEGNFIQVDNYYED